MKTVLIDLGYLYAQTKLKITVCPNGSVTLQERAGENSMGSICCKTAAVLEGQLTTLVMKVPYDGYWTVNVAGLALWGVGGDDLVVVESPIVGG